jgi:hypothetical protein
MRSALVFVLLAACEVGTPSGNVTPPGDDDVDGSVAPGTPDAATPNAPDAAAPDPADDVDWFTWPSQQSTTDATWGNSLTDIHNHLPASYGDTYWFDDAITAGHETTHGIQAHLRNYEAPTDGARYNAFYVLGDKAAFVREPDIRKSDIVPQIPQSLRGPRFDTYLTGQTEWDDTPLYVYDEWNAYVNGADVGVDQVQDGLYDDGWTDAVMGPLEFCVYAIATVKATAAGDPSYFAADHQLKAFTAWELERAMGLFATGRAMSDFTWQDQDDYAAAMRTGADGEALRQFARDTWGAGWTQQVLGF